MAQYEKLLEELKDGSLPFLTITKEEFLAFREILIAREDFKQFKGVAKQGGNVVYSYEL